MDKENADAKLGRWTADSCVECLLDDLDSTLWALTLAGSAD
jgi:hypothetical protein